MLVTDPTHPFVEAWWPPGHIIGYEHTFTHTVVDFVHAIASGEQPKPDFADGLRNQRLLDAIARSASSRSWESA